MDQSLFPKTSVVITSLKNTLKCQLCCELKSHELVFYYKSCGHFYCSKCDKDKNSCMLCIDKQDNIPLELIDDKNMLSLYEKVLNLKLPLRNEVEHILASFKQSAVLASPSVVYSTDENLPGSSVKKKRLNNKCKSRTSNEKSEALSKQPKKLSKVQVCASPPPPDSIKNLANNDTPIKCRTIPNNNQKGSTGKKKINVAKKNHKGETLLHLACKKGCISEMKSLIDGGADVNAQDNAGWTPLHDSVVKGNLDVVQLLLQRGAKINTPGLENNTPLHEAVACMNDKVCELLMKYGADVRSKNITGDTPLDLAKKFNNIELQEILLHTKPNVNLHSEFERSSDVIEENVVIWKCQLNETEEQAAEKFAREFNAEVANTYPFCSPKAVTHIIVPSNGKVALNWAIISSVVSGSWIVDSRWIFDSLKDKTMKPLKEYAIQNEFFKGFEVSRLNKINQLPGLFSGCHFYFHGSLVNYYVGKIKIMKDHVSSLVKKNGGVILKRSPDPESMDLERTVPFHASEKSSIASTSYYIIYQTGKNEPGIKYNMSHMKTLPIDWLMLCIFKFRLIDPGETDNYLKDFLQE